MTPDPLTDPAALTRLRRDMLRFAELQVRDRALVEDVVQDALIKAMDKRASFEGRASIKTWVFSILRNTLINAIRSRARFVDVAAADKEGDASALDALFDSTGRWMDDARPDVWLAPDQAAENSAFWEVLEVCLNDLPENTARVFTMREFLGLATDEIGETTGMSVSNIHVVLHRARMGLRECLRQRWFETEAVTC